MDAAAVAEVVGGHGPESRLTLILAEGFGGKSGFQLAIFRRVLTLPFDFSARTRPRAKRRTMAIFLAPCPVR